MVSWKSDLNISHKACHDKILFIFFCLDTILHILIDANCNLFYKLSRNNYHYEYNKINFFIIQNIIYYLLHASSSKHV